MLFELSVTVLIPVMIVSLFHYLRGGDRSALWALRRWHRTLIRDLHEGTLVKIVGRVQHASGSLCAPLGSRNCIGYDLKIDWLGEHPANLHHEARCSDFLIEDSTGKIRVRSSQVRFALVKDEHLQKETFINPTPELKVLLKQYGNSVFLLSGLAEYHIACRQSVLEAGEEIAVYGRVCAEPGLCSDGHEGYREPPMQFVLESPANGELLISDDAIAMAGVWHVWHR